MNTDPKFMQKYQHCMVCSVNPESEYKDYNSWKKTKTNINKVCLFNFNAKPNSDILNYEGCMNNCISPISL